MTEDASHSRSLRLLINDDGDSQTAASPRCCWLVAQGDDDVLQRSRTVSRQRRVLALQLLLPQSILRRALRWYLPWAGGAQRCNVHHLSGPKCPWCNVRNTALAALAWAISDNFTVCMMVLSYVAVMLLQRQRTRHWLPTSKRQLAMRVSTAMATFLALGFAMGLVFYAGTDYPCFLWIADNATRCGWQGARAEKFT